jgi:hypothetical protein
MQLASHRSVLSVWVITAMTVLLGGCYTTSQVVSYRLTEPTAPLVRHRVAVGDQLEVRLKNSTTHNIKVTEITDTEIRGKDGTTIPINTIERVTGTITETEMTGLTEAALGGAAEGAAPLIVIFAIPAMWGKSLYEQSLGPARGWPHDQLCDVSNLPDQFGYIATGENQEYENWPDLEAINREIERRELNCDTMLLTEKHCAGFFTHGPAFTKCTKIVEPLERSGRDGIQEWDNQLLCEAHSGLLPFVTVDHNLAYFTKISDFISNEVKRRETDCTIFGLKQELH